MHPNSVAHRHIAEEFRDFLRANGFSPVTDEDIVPLSMCSVDEDTVKIARLGQEMAKEMLYSLGRA